MAISVVMPQMGESVVEGTVERWLVREGERVEKDQILCEITTDKVDAEVVAPESGVVTRIVAPQGQTVPVGAELASLEPVGAAATTAPAAAAPAAATPKPVTPAAATGPATADAPRVSPVARRVAEEKGIDLGSVAGSGVAGRVMKADVTAARPASQRRGAACRDGRRAAAAPGSLGEFLAHMRVPTHRIAPEDKVIPFTAIRRRIAEHMVVSKVVSPHVGTVAEVDLSKLAKLRDRHKKAFEQAHGFGLSFLPFVVAATVRGAARLPARELGGGRRRDRRARRHPRGRGGRDRARTARAGGARHRSAVAGRDRRGHQRAGAARARPHDHAPTSWPAAPSRSATRAARGISTASP